MNALEGNRARMFKVIAPIEHKDGTHHWLRIGSAFPNKDASINLYLDAIPLGSKVLQIREMTDEDFARRRDHNGGSGPPLPPPAPSGRGNADLPF